MAAINDIAIHGIDFRIHNGAFTEKNNRKRCWNVCKGGSNFKVADSSWLN